MAEENSELREKFDRLDKDGSGYITAPELRNALQWARLSDAQVDRIIEVADADSDGKIQFNEFANLDVLVRERIKSDWELRKMFRMFDRDGSGFITGRSN